jgi:MYXO-CTERM domain-containing protein
MKWIAFAAGLTLSTAAALAGSPAARAQATCVNDVDCTANGTACGTDVCSWVSTTHTCVPSSGDPGWCTTDTDCKCHSEGATCMAAHCTIVKGADGGSSADAGATSTTSTTSNTSSSSSSETSGGGGGSSGGCSVGFGAGGSGALAALGMACALVARRRRRT